MSNSFKYQDATTSKALIKSNETDEEVDISGCIECAYVESIYDDTIRVQYTIANTSGTVDGKTLLEGLPLVGTEDFKLVIEDGSGNSIETNLNVNKVRIIDKDNRKEILSISFVSEELIRTSILSMDERIRFCSATSDSTSFCNVLIDKSVE